jgi:uncharacterized RDD family membrane protein YckC
MLGQDDLAEGPAYDSRGHDLSAAQPPAPFGKRLFATLIDAIFFVPPLFSFLPVFLPVEWGLLLMLGCGMAYQVLMEASPCQGTVGKLGLGLRVVGPDGGRVGLLRAAARAVAKLVFILLSPLAPLLCRQSLAPYDALTGTFVVEPERLLTEPTPAEELSVGLPAASIHARLLALGLDLTMFLGWCGVLMLGLLVVCVLWSVSFNGPLGAFVLVAVWLWLALFLVFYAPLMEASPLQATLGKYLAGVRVVGPDGGRVPWLRAVGRHLLRLLCVCFFPVALLVIFLDARRRWPHDMLTGCEVVGARLARLAQPCTTPALPSSAPPPAEGITRRDTVRE